LSVPGADGHRRRPRIRPDPLRRISKTEALALLAAEAADIEARFNGCAMCAAAAGFPPEREVLGSNAAAVALLDRFAARPAHVVIVLRRHVETLAELPWDEYALVQRLAWEAARALQKTLEPKRIYVASLGAARRIATSFPHHHVHVVPLTDGGEADRPAEVLTWSHGVYVYEDGEARRLRARLQAAWPVE
jgi:diadenosine tetraphosphate (Ap4A) HIT family hydrolase